MTQFSILSKDEHELLTHAIQMEFDYLNDTSLDDINYELMSQVDRTQLNVIRKQMGDKFDRLILLVRLQERLAQCKPTE